MQVSHPSLAVMHRMFDEGFATGNDAIVDELCSPDLVEHQFGLAATGAEAIAHVKTAIRDVHAAVPDMRFTIEDSVVDGDRVWVRVRGCGTNTGPFFGPPSHQPVDITVFRPGVRPRRPDRRALGSSRQVCPSRPDRGARACRLRFTYMGFSQPGHPAGWRASDWDRVA